MYDQMNRDTSLTCFLTGSCRWLRSLLIHLSDCETGCCCSCWLHCLRCLNSRWCVLTGPCMWWTSLLMGWCRWLRSPPIHLSGCETGCCYSCCSRHPSCSLSPWFGLRNPCKSMTGVVRRGAGGSAGRAAKLGVVVAAPGLREGRGCRKGCRREDDEKCFHGVRSAGRGFCLMKVVACAQGACAH